MLNEQQIENRKKGVGASEAAIVLGLNKFISPYQLWMIKTGKMQQEDISHLPQVYWGTIHEEQIAREYAKLNNCKVIRDNDTRFHKDHEFMLCHIDRKIVGLRKLLECKFAMFAKDDWGPNGSDIVPLSYIVQVQHQLAVTGYDEADLAVLIGGWDFRVYHFKRDEQIINKIISELKEFWHCVENGIAPPLRDRTDATLAYPFCNGNLKEADSNVIESINKIREIKAKAKVLETEEEKLKSNLTMFIQDAEGVRDNTQVLATWKPRKDGVRVFKLMEARA